MFENCFKILQLMVLKRHALGKTVNNRSLLPGLLQISSTAEFFSKDVCQNQNRNARNFKEIMLVGLNYKVTLLQFFGIEGKKKK